MTASELFGSSSSPDSNSIDFAFSMSKYSSSSSSPIHHSKKTPSGHDEYALSPSKLVASPTIQVQAVALSEEDYTTQSHDPSVENHQVLDDDNNNNDASLIIPTISLQPPHSSCKVHAEYVQYPPVISHEDHYEDKDNDGKLIDDDYIHINDDDDDGDGGGEGNKRLNVDMTPTTEDLSPATVDSLPSLPSELLPNDIHLLDIQHSSHSGILTTNIIPIDHAATAALTTTTTSFYDNDPNVESLSIHLPVGEGESDFNNAFSPIENISSSSSAAAAAATTADHDGEVVARQSDDVVTIDHHPHHYINATATTAPSDIDIKTSSNESIASPGEFSDHIKSIDAALRAISTERPHHESSQAVAMDIASFFGGDAPPIVVDSSKTLPQAVSLLSSSSPSSLHSTSQPAMFKGRAKVVTNASPFNTTATTDLFSSSSSSSSAINAVDSLFNASSSSLATFPPSNNNNNNNNNNNYQGNNNSNNTSHPLTMIMMINKGMMEPLNICKYDGCNNEIENNTVSYCRDHRSTRRCNVDGCCKCAQGATKYCISHGGGRRCTHEGCNKGARDRLFCAAHGGGKRCHYNGK
jgi:hypothetical protein